MKRKEKKEVRFRKVSTGVHIQNGVKYKKGDILICDPEEIPEVFKNGFVQLTGVKPEEEGISLKLQQRGTKGGWYDIINEETGKPINDKALTKEQAMAIIDGE